MAGQQPSSSSHHHRLHSSSLKSASSSNQLTSSKLKTLLQTFIFSHLYRILRALAKAKTIFFQVIKDIHLLQFIQLSVKKSRKGLKSKLFVGSFRLHYNWCSPHVIPAPRPPHHHHHLEGYYSSSEWYYDASWNTEIPTTTTEDSSEEFMVARNQEYVHFSSELMGYLHWLEERDQCSKQDRRTLYYDHQQQENNDDIDKMADAFIANSHEKFRLEKQESYRRFQEMMDRSI